VHQQNSPLEIRPSRVGGGMSRYFVVVATDHHAAQDWARTLTAAGCDVQVMEEPPAGAVVCAGGLRVNPATRCVSVDGCPVELTDAEFNLLLLFVRQPGRVLSRDDLSVQLRNLPFDGRDRSLDLRVARLRAKLGDDPVHPRFIRTVRGEGYLLLPQA
jgi:two-component system, OmpR family, response regulator RstA